MVKRTLIFIVKNNIPIPNNIGAPVKVEQKFNKSKLFFKKGSCNLKVELPKNYFLFSEKLSFNINFNRKDLKMKIKKLSISLYREIRKNNSNNKLRSLSTIKIQSKDYIINENQDIYNINDCFYLSNSSQKQSFSDVYNVLEKHGLFEINEKYDYLYPSCAGGLLSIDYYLKAKIYFESSLTFDETIRIPLNFYIDNNNNQNKENNQSNNININSDSNINHINIINNNNNNSNIIEQNNINIENNLNTNEFNASTPNINNIDEKSNNIEDKKENLI